MKNFFIFAFSFCSIFGFAQNKSALLYKISGNGTTQPSYIFGTIHLSCEAKLNQEIQKALEATSQLYLELDMDDPEMQNKMMKSLGMNDNVKISSLLSAEDYAFLDNYLKTKMNVSVAAFDSYKPFIISTMFLGTLLDCTPQSIENELVRYSTIQKKPIYGLETVEEQMDIFNQIPYQLQAEELINSVKADFRNDKIELDAMINTYAKKDLDAMQKIIDNSESMLNGEYRDLLLKDRNHNWISKIERIVKDKPTFFGVGAAHLLGEDGVIMLLRNKGYTIEPLY